MRYPQNAVRSLKNFKKFIQFNIDEYIDKISKNIQRNQLSDDYLQDYYVENIKNIQANNEISQIGNN